MLGKFKLRVVGHRLQLRLERAVLRLERVLGAGTQGSAGYDVRAPTRCAGERRIRRQSAVRARTTHVRARHSGNLLPELRRWLHRALVMHHVRVVVPRAPAAVSPHFVGGVGLLP